MKPQDGEGYELQKNRSGAACFLNLPHQQNVLARVFVALGRLFGVFGSIAILIFLVCEYTSKMGIRKARVSVEVPKVTPEITHGVHLEDENRGSIAILIF